MNISLRTSMAIGALTLLTNAAQASARQTFDPYTWGQPSINLVWTPHALSAINAMNAEVTETDPAKLSWLASTVSGFNYLSMTTHLPLASVTQDEADGRLLGAHFTGGFQVIAERDDLTNTGGALSIYNLRIDMPSQSVFATMEGANGVGLINDIALWRFTDAASSVSDDDDLRLTIPNLAFTPEGMDRLSQSLGLLSDGQSAWNTVESFGLISAVPEASTYSMAMLGLLGLAAVARGKARD